jgi:hypothetical protein
MPADTVSVARPTIWGNPYRLGALGTIVREPAFLSPAATWEYVRPSGVPNESATYMSPAGGRVHCRLRHATASEVVELFRRQLTGDLSPDQIAAGIRPGLRAYPFQLLGVGPDDVKRKLRGKNLACWCPLDQPCHADTLLEIANA